MVQSLMLDILLARSWPLFIFYQAFARKAGVSGYTVTVVSLWTILVLLLVLAWLLGFLAVYGSGKRRFALDRLSDAPSNGFEAWVDPPMFGVWPSPVLVRIVRTIGPNARAGLTWQNGLVGLTYLGAICLAFLVFFAPHHAAAMYPMPDTNSARQATFWGCLAVTAVIILRTWAAEGRRRLEGAFTPERPATMNVAVP